VTVGGGVSGLTVPVDRTDSVRGGESLSAGAFSCAVTVMYRDARFGGGAVLLYLCGHGCLVQI
jgi:hypothetical protein